MHKTIKVELQTVCPKCLDETVWEQKGTVSGVIVHPCENCYGTWEDFEEERELNK